MRKRVAGLIVKDNQILVMHRVKPDMNYYTFVGGGVEDGETIDQAFKREIAEELTIEIKKYRLLFQIINYNERNGETREEFFHLIEEYSGTPTLGGPEAEISNPSNLFEPVWLPLEQFLKLTNIYPKKAQDKVIEILTLNKANNG